MAPKTQSPTPQNDRNSAGNPPGDKEPVFFFKIILPPALQHNTLNIPNKFVKEYGNDLSSMAKFVVPASQSWTVRIRSQGRTFWFGDGLSDFFKYYSVTCGYFFVFDYRGDSVFGVRIFDLTTCEIEYPTPLYNETELLIHEDGDEDEDKDEENDVNCGSDDGEDDVLVLDRSEPKVFDSRDVIELSSEDEDEDDEEFEVKPDIVGKNSMVEPCSRKRKMDETSGSSGGKKMDHSPKKDSFKVVMMPYNINTPLLNVPAHIGRRYPKDAVGGTVKLEVSNGRTWTVQGNFLRARLRSLGRGWLEFVRDNKLRVDKVCVFELIESDKEFRIKVSGSNQMNM